jgi:hypothetical protein
MFSADRYMITIAESRGFSADAERVFSSEERDALIETIAWQPIVGDVIDEPSGVRMIKWPAKSQGRYGVARVVYYFRDLNTPVYLLALYEKGERLMLSQRERTVIRALVAEIVDAFGVKWSETLQNGAA